MTDVSQVPVTPPATPPAPPKPPTPPVSQGAAGGLTSGHALVGVGASTITGYLTILLTGYQTHGFPQGLDVAHAGSAAALIVMAAGATYKLIAWGISIYNPKLRPLPDSDS